MTLFCLLGIAWSCAVQAKEPSVNFTSRKRVALPEKPSYPSTELRVNGDELKDAPVVSSEPVLPVPISEPTVRAEPVEARTEMPTVPEVPTTPAPTAEQPVPPLPTALEPPPETVWLDDDLPKGSSTEGTWIWETSLAASGVKSHGHPPGEKIQFHAITFAKPLPIRATQMIVQQVWLDPQNPPRGIALEFQRAGGEKAGVYWEGETEVFNPAEYEDLWYYGMLPELGKWITLEILAEDLGLEEAQLTGIRFLTFDGRVLWDKTSIKEAPPLEGASPTPPIVNSAQVFDRPS